MDEWATRAARRMLAGLGELCFGFGLAESLFVGALFVLGARYVPAGPPIVLILFLVVLRLAAPGRPRANRVFLHLFWFTTCFLAATGLIAAALPPASTPLLLARVMHQVMAVVGTLVWATWIHGHVRRSVAPDTPRAVRVSGRAAWLVLKVSLWSGAVVALLVILEGLIPVHVTSLAIAVVPLAVHVVAARRWRAATSAGARPAPYLALTDRGIGRVLGSSGVLGVAFAVLLTWGPRAYDGVNLAVGHERATTVARASFGDGFVVTESGAGYSPVVLAQSRACGGPSCHPFVFADWKASPHRHTASVAYLDAVEAFATTRGRAAAGLCASCHDPISAIAGVVGETGELTTPEGRREGLSCLVCHSTITRSEPGAAERLVFRFPAQFGAVSLDARSMLALTPEHRLELGLGHATSSRPCVLCHRIPALPGDDPQRHRQSRMRPECRGDVGCVDCHMPRVSRNARPGQPLAPSHTFAASAPSSPAEPVRP